MARTAYNPVHSYTGTGVLYTYAFTFKIEALSQLEVVEYDTFGVETQRVRGTDTVYLSSVTFDATEGGGSVTLVGVLTTGYTLKLLLANDAPTQLSEFRNKGSFTLRAIENALDFVVGPIQRLTYLMLKTMRLSDYVSSDDFDTTLPDEILTSPGKALIINSTADGFALGADLLAGSSGITGLTGDVIASGSGSVPATIANNVVSNAKLVTVPTTTIKGRVTAGTGNSEDLTATQATTILNAVVGDSGSGGTKGLVPAPPSGSNAANVNRYLKANGLFSSHGKSFTSAAGGGTYTALDTDDVININGVSMTIALPTAVGVGGKIYEIIHGGTSITNVHTIDGFSAETIGGSATYIMRIAGHRLKIISNNTNWTILDESIPFINSEIYIDSPTGYGSTNTKIPIYSLTKVDTSSPFMTYATSATLGASVTVNVTGLYSVKIAADGSAAILIFGISVNGSALTTSILTTSYANGGRGFAYSTATVNDFRGYTTLIHLTAGDIIRPHTDGAALNNNIANIFDVILIQPKLGV